MQRHNENVVEEAGDDEVIAVALRRSLAVVAVLGLVGLLSFWLTRPDQPALTVVQDVALPDKRSTSASPMPTIRFTDITKSCGINFEHENGAYGEKLLPETMGSGCAFLDFDRDGDQDLVLVNSQRWPWDPRPATGEQATLGVYRNLGQGQFEDATQTVGLDISMYGMGAAVGDYDNDGQVDLFISAVGKNRLFRNDGELFVDVTEDAGVGGAAEQWSSSAAWIDYDNDGWLDLFVCNYVQWSRELDLAQDFRLTGVGRAYGPPMSFQGSHPYLYRNQGDGTFRDVSQAAGIQQINASTGVPLAKSLGVAPIDLDRDGWIDLVVANDTVRNLVFRNLGDGTFAEIGMQTGIAFDTSGKARGAMGIDAAAFRNTDSIGVAIANFSNEMTALYVSSGEGMLFTDDAVPTGLGPPTRTALSFGLFFFDYDLDGRLDLLSANGHLENEIHLVQQSQTYRQSAQLFWNAGPDQPSEFVAVPTEYCGRDLFKPIVGRGAAYADIDSDGDVDVLMTQTGGPPLLLRNDQALGHHYVRLALQGTSANRNAIGAWIEVHLPDRILWRQVMPSRSYLSQVELPVTIGLGAVSRVEKVVITWPGGHRQQVMDVCIDQTNTVVQSR